MAKLDKSALAGALMFGAAMSGEPALAEGKSPSFQLASTTSGQVTDCVAFVKGQRSLAKENGVTMTRKDQKSLLHQCNNGQLETRIAEQEKILAALDKRIREWDLRLDGQARILDAQGNELARIVSINGQLIVRRQQAENRIASADQRTAQALDQIERYLLENS